MTETCAHSREPGKCEECRLDDFVVSVRCHGAEECGLCSESAVAIEQLRARVIHLDGLVSSAIDLMRDAPTDNYEDGGDWNERLVAFAAEWEKDR